MTAAGLLLGGQLVATPGVTAIPPASHGGPAWNRLDPGDYMARPGGVQLLVNHSAGGRWPQPILPGAGPPGHARQVLEMWSGDDHGGGDRVHSAAQLVIDFEGTIYCAGDLLRCAAYHAPSVHARAVGIEMCTTPRGELYQATIDVTVRLLRLLTWSGVPGAGLLPIPAQMPRGPYRGAPLRRLELGGKGSDGRDLVGVIGHCDQSSQRGRGRSGRCDLDGARWGGLRGAGLRRRRGPRAGECQAAVAGGARRAAGGGWDRRVAQLGGSAEAGVGAVARRTGGGTYWHLHELHICPAAQLAAVSQASRQPR